MGGLLSENGPFFPDGTGNLTNNPYSWNTVASVVYIESPVQVGFSIMPGVQHYTDEKTAADNLAVLQGFYKLYPQYKYNNLMLSGESYAGHYIPMLAKLIWDQKAFDPLGSPQRNFRGFLLGNPSTDRSYDHDNTSKAAFLRMHAFSRLDSTSLQPLPAGVSAYDILADVCVADDILNAVRYPNPFVDQLRAEEATISKRGDDRPVCISEHVTTYLNRPEVQQAIHAQPTQWQKCGGPFYDYGPQSIIPLYQYFYNSTDLNFWVFSGDVDTVISFVSTQSWILKMGLPYKSEWAPWYYSNPLAKNGKQVGGFEIIMASDRFRYRTVRGAGHMVPWNTPAPALAMLKDYLASL